MQSLLRQIESTKSGVKPFPVNVENAGTVMRFLTALLAVTPGNWLLSGDERMNRRPVGILAEALKKLGADISFQGEEGFPPLLIHTSHIAGGELEIDAGTSSQFITALMLIAPVLPKGINLHLKGDVVSQPYISLTAELMKSFGAKVKIEGRDISVQPSGYKKTQLSVEADWSAASYWYEMAAFATQAEIRLKLLEKDSLQGDSVLAEIYQKFGVFTEYHPGFILLRKGNQPIVHSFEYDFTHCPDLAQTLAVTCAGLGVPAVLKGLSTLKIKETDRLQAVVNELNKTGVNCKADESSLIIESAHASGREIHLDTYNDHRMAMAFAPLAALGWKLIIRDPDVVVKSYPGFWDDLKTAGFIIKEL